MKNINTDYECREAQNGAEALKLLRREKQLPDFIFLDLNMPQMDGRECLEELKKDERLKYIPVIIYTTSSFEQDKLITQKLGAAYYLVKPADVSELSNEILRAIEIAKEFVVQ